MPVAEASGYADDPTGLEPLYELHVSELLEWGEKFRRHPVAQRYAQLVQRRGVRFADAPEHVLGDRSCVLGDFLLTEHHHPGRMRMPSKPEARGEQLLNRALSAFVAPPYLWPSEILNVVAELPLPRHVISPRLLPVPRSWHAFIPEAIMSVDEDVAWLTGREYAIRGCLIEDAGQEFVITSFLCDAHDYQRLAVDARRYEYGKTYPDDFYVDGPGDGKSLLALVLSMFAFLSSPYIPKRTAHPNRTARRQLKMGKAEATQEVTFVILRRAATRKTNGELSETVAWKHRWIVSGHYRAQWYPSEQAHRVIWIAPYMKGPEDAPLLEHVYKVAR